MSGEELKEKIHEAGYTVEQVSRMMGYTNYRKLYAELRYKTTKTDLIEKLSKATGIRVGWWFGEDEHTTLASAPAPNVVKRTAKGKKVKWGNSDEPLQVSKAQEAGFTDVDELKRTMEVKMEKILLAMKEIEKIMREG